MTIESSAVVMSLFNHIAATAIAVNFSELLKLQHEEIEHLVAVSSFACQLAADQADGRGFCVDL